MIVVPSTMKVGVRRLKDLTPSPKGDGNLVINKLSIFESQKLSGFKI